MFEMPIKYPNRDVKTFSYVILDLKGEIKARDKNRNIISFQEEFKVMELDRKSLPKCLKTHTRDPTDIITYLIFLKVLGFMNFEKN